MVDRETGQAIGEHRGLWFHTIGQRKGVGPGLHAGYVNLGPWYVSGKDMATNVLEVTNDREAIDGPRESFQVFMSRRAEGVRISFVRESPRDLKFSPRSRSWLRP